MSSSSSSKTDLGRDARLSEASEAVKRAEAVLEAMMNEIEVNERADKKMIGEALRTAFDALRLARSNLEALRSGH